MMNYKKAYRAAIAGYGKETDYDLRLLQQQFIRPLNANAHMQQVRDCRAVSLEQWRELELRHRKQ